MKGVQQVWAAVENLIVEGHGTDELVFTSLLRAWLKTKKSYHITAVGMKTQTVFEC